MFSLYVSRDGKRFQPVGAVSVPLADPVHVGLGVGSHERGHGLGRVLGRGLDNPGVVAADKRVVESTLEVISIETGVRETVYTARDHFEAPNWPRDGKTLLFNSGGQALPLPAGRRRRRG